MPNARNMNMAVGDVVVCRVLRQRNNIQIYLPRAAVRYLGVAPGDNIYVTAGPNGVTVSRAELTATQAAQAQRAVAAPVTTVTTRANTAVNPAVAQLAALQAQINQLSASLNQAPPTVAAAPAVQAAQAGLEDLAAEVRRYRRQR